MSTAPTVDRLADKIVASWHSRSSCPERIEIPLGITAALMLNPLTTNDTRALAAWFAQLDDRELLAAIDEIWAYAWIADPYLIDTAHELHQWTSAGIDAPTIAAIRAIIATALDNEITRLASLAAPSEVDLLGQLLMQLRPAAARQHLGEFYTPTHLADLIADMTNPGLPPAGASFTDPCAGSGGMILAAANRIRALGGDPADYVWVLSDVNPLAVAAAAANAMSWKLGPNVLVYRADALATPDAGIADAIERRAAVHHNHRRHLNTARILTALRAIDADNTSVSRQPDRRIA